MFREIAEKNVLKIRGSYDAPDFEACVRKEMLRLQQENKKKLKNQEQMKHGCLIAGSGG